MTAYDDTVRGEVPTPPHAWDKINGTAQQVLKVKRLHRGAVLPQYATEGSACFDLHAIVDDASTNDTVVMRGGINTAHTFRTGLSFEVPAGHVLLVFSRSGHGFNHDTRLANCVGVIDSDYRGEVRVRLSNDGRCDFVVTDRDRIAQAMLVPIPRVQLLEVDELTDTARGTGGFGSTGA